jgi:hypothetical protein
VITTAVLERDAVIVACAISAGIHAALTPDHFAEGSGAGLGFLGATVLLALLVVTLTRQPTAAASLGAVAVLAGLIGSYVLAITSGLPLIPRARAGRRPRRLHEGDRGSRSIRGGASRLARTPCVRAAASTTERNTDMKTHAYRPIPLALTMLIAIFSALVALAVSGGHDAAAHGDHGAATISKQEFVFRQEMRRLWEDHVTWTRLAVISLTTDSPDTKATVGRLLQNQTGIGRAIRPYYGAAAARQLTELLREHILIAADLIAVARKGDEAGVASQQARWTRNADQIATFLNRANPTWRLGVTKAMMREHLRLTTSEVVARLQRDWTADVRAYDRIHRQALHMADMLSRGIVQQFPGRFR